MGKPKQGIGSSLKALFNLKPLSPKSSSWVCVQQARTDSFREVYKNFNTIYCKEEMQLAVLPPGQDDSMSTSCSSSSLTTDSQHKEDTRRFFFHPCTTKSIMELEYNPAKTISDVNYADTGDEALVKELCFETEEERGKGVMGICKKSVRMSMASEDPYMDFRSSMEEMVAAHGLKDWSCLEELLHCYLKLNDEDTHKFIMLAFVDLLMAALLEQETKEDSSQIESSCSSCLSLDEEVKECKRDKQEEMEQEIEHLNL